MRLLKNRSRDGSMELSQMDGKEAFQMWLENGQDLGQRVQASSCCHLKSSCLHHGEFKGWHVVT